MLSKKNAALVLMGVVLCASCLYQESGAEQQQEDKFNAEFDPFRPFIKNMAMDPEPAKDPQSLWDGGLTSFYPLRFIFLVLRIITFPPRFILRFIYTILAVVIFTIFECKIFPEVRCFGPFIQLIPNMMETLRKELDALVHYEPLEYGE